MRRMKYSTQYTSKMSKEAKHRSGTTHSWQLWVIYVLLAANLSEQQALKQACPSCDNAQLCNCSAMGLDFIPPGLTAKITMLNLTYNRIKHIRSQDLRQAVNLQTLLLQSNKISSIDEDSFQSLAKLELLNLSNNNLAHLSPVWFEHLFSLQRLHLQGNFYRDLGESSPFSGLRNLSSLRLGNPQFSVIRQGNFEGIEFVNELWIDGDACEWPKNLKYLNLSSTQIPKVTDCIPQTLEVLDISANNLKEFGLQLPHLKELYLTKNQLKTLPGAAPIPNVAVMSVRRNKLNSFSKEEFESFKRMELLDASDNNFICSCEFLSFIHHEAGISQVLVGWPDKYVCDSPLAVRGAQVGAVHLSVMECHRSLVVSLICILVFLVILILVAVGYKYHAVWYLRMTWAWLQAKRKPKRAPPKDICYDAFVSYSENDSNWVENIMVRELEQACPPFRLCLHKRDFVPGKWIVDNIIDSIEKSHKTLFVLSEHFVQSEWCKYELDFSHFRLFDENNDAAILVLLEPIQSKTIPKRFCKLRKIMNTKTYLEWPLEEEQQQMFWENLKRALKS
ncbi:toll-like receptor 2 type-1 [Pitangus sulphuratus]|nr:toll-like receptor 2 type-1 [Pitangus sulphuratus]